MTVGIVLRKLSTLVLVLASLACGKAPESTPPPNVLIVLVDTLRADRLGAYGSRRGLTPFIDELAERSTVFRMAYAPNSWTSPSIASLLTSRYQSQHGILNRESVLSPGERTLPETLKENGYVSGAFSANPLIDADRGFSQGYDKYQVVLPQRTRVSEGYVNLVTPRAQTIVGNALVWLETLARAPRRPVYLYLHFMEPHIPYQPEEEALERVFNGRPRPNATEAGRAALQDKFTSVDADMLRDIEDLYDAEVASLDIALRTLFDGLRQVGFLDHALVVFTADHGQEFHDHGRIGHGRTLYQELIHVPLLMQRPGQTQRRDVDVPVGLVDLAPTIVRAAGVEIPASFEGRPLDDDLLDRPDADRRPVLSFLLQEKTPHQRAIVVGRAKLIESVGGAREFYDLDRDPQERDGNALAAPERSALVRALESLDDGAPTTAESKPLDAERLERLKALGYVD